MEARLQTRYQTLVEQHSTPVSALASGLRALSDGGQAFAATQAAWLFFANPKVTLPALCQPLRAYAHQKIAAQAQDYGLVVHDWSWLDDNGHTNKHDRKAPSHQHAPGYELLSALAVSTQSGAPLAPLALSLECAEGVYTSQDETCQPAWEGHQEALWAQVEAVERLALASRCVRCVDREADSVALHR